MIVTDIVGKRKSGTESTGFYMDRWLKENLDGIPKFLRKDWDCVGVVSGSGLVRSGKCFDLNTTKLKIVNDNGEIVDSDYLINYSDGKKLKTVSWNFSNDKLVYSESEFFKTGKKKVYEIETTDGRKIRCSEDHKLFVKRRSWESNNKTTWKIFELKLKDIKKGDRLVCEKK